MEHYTTSETTDKVFKALHEFHKDPPPIVKEGTVSVPGRPERKYVTLDSILHAVRPALALQGLFIMQHLAGDSLLTIIQHESGQFIQSHFPFQTMQGSGTNNLQNLGGGLTYLRRYALTAILGIAADEDDDGSTGGIEKKTEPVKKENEPEKWLNKLNKDGSMTPEWSNMLKGIEMGTVKSIAHLRQFYKIAKKEAAEIETLIPTTK